MPKQGRPAADEKSATNDTFSDKRTEYSAIALAQAYICRHKDSFKQFLMNIKGISEGETVKIYGEFMKKSRL